jgi:hypothetical protein
LRLKLQEEIGGGMQAHAGTRRPLSMKIIALFGALAAVLASNSALAAIGPTQSPLRITAMYTKDNGSIYVAFQPGAMPGCYANSGGYLFSSNTFFKEIYAQLLTLVASGGIQASVIYTQNTPTGNWGDCTVDGLYLIPQ